MEIKKYNTYSKMDRNVTTFKEKVPVNTGKLQTAVFDLGDDIIKNLSDNTKLQDVVKGSTPKYLKFLSNILRKIAPTVEDKLLHKRSVDDVVNVGNQLKELVCMVVYPLQVLTNPDLSKEKRRFVGMYDFFVTCVSLAGATWATLWGSKWLKKAADGLMKKYKYNSKYPNVERAIKGGGFVLNIAIMTILFKRIIAPAVSPPLAAKVRKNMEAKDAQKAGLVQNSETKENEKKSQDKKASDVMIPAEHDAALSKTKADEKSQNKFSKNDFKFAK